MAKQPAYADLETTTSLNMALPSVIQEPEDTHVLMIRWSLVRVSPEALAEGRVQLAPSMQPTRSQSLVAAH